jgi:hypothetical protein
MATATLTAILNAEPDPPTWRIGEALAESVLQEHRGAMWPWNDARDRKTPRASLPGADLVGFLPVEETVVLLFGEVKTSSAKDTPPSVMTGRTGMIHQLESLATDRSIHSALLMWLHARCRDESFKEAYKIAVGNYFNSGGLRLALVGVLVRDTDPNVLDVQSRALALSKQIQHPGTGELIAMYVPAPVTSWLAMLNAV